MLKRFNQFYFVLLILLQGGCRSMQEDYDATLVTLNEQWGKDISASEKREERTFVWEEAIQELMQKNQLLKKASVDYGRAERDIAQVYRDLLPRVRAGLFFSEAMDDLEDSDFTDWSFDLSGYWMFGGLLDLNKDLYRARLLHYRSGLLYKQKLRSQILEMYVLHSKMRLNLKKRQLIEDFQHYIVDQNGSDTFKLRLANDLSEFDQGSKKMNQKLNALFAVANIDWTLSDEETPALFDFDDGVYEKGELQRSVWATDIVASMAALRGMTLKQWPQFSMNATSGSLISTAEDSSVFDESNRYFYARFTIPVDLTGKTYRDASEAREDLERLRIVLEDTQSQLIASLRFKSDRLSLLEKEIEREKKILRTQGQVLSILSPHVRLSKMSLLYAQWLQIYKLEEEQILLRQQLLFYQDANWLRYEKLLFELYEKGQDA